MELVALVERGMTSLQALRAATVTSAELIGRDDELGRLQDEGPDGRMGEVATRPRSPPARRGHMRFTLGLPTDHIEQPEFFTASALMRMAQVAEQAGFGAVNITDHPFPPAKWVAAGGHHDLDPITGLAFAAAATNDILLHTNIYVAAYRNPFLTAKSVATLDTLSGGRVIFGVGAGYLTPEFAALGVPFERRGARLDRALDAIVRAWTGEPLTAETDEWTAAGNQLLPLPASRPHPPIWVGGNSEAAMRRVARIAQGWIPFPAGKTMAKAVRTTALSSVDDLQARIGTLRGYRAEAGRADDPLDVCCTPFSNPYQQQRHDLKALEQEVYELAAAGVTWMCIYLPVTDLDGYLHEIERFGEMVIRPTAANGNLTALDSC